MQNAPMLLQRRAFVSSLALGVCGSALAQADPQDEQLAARLRAGACVLLLRHARTTPGIGDPAGFRLETCSTQRNLNDEGRAQSRAIGEWFRAAALRPRTVRSSAWCRCRDTAVLAFGTYEPWPPLDSTFGTGAASTAAVQPLRDELARTRKGVFEVWVTHQVNITGLTGEYVAMGEGVVVDRAARTVGRRRFG